jgi:hypothetical protein
VVGVARPHRPLVGHIQVILRGLMHRMVKMVLRVVEFPVVRGEMVVLRLQVVLQDKQEVLVVGFTRMEVRVLDHHFKLVKEGLQFSMVHRVV